MRESLVALGYALLLAALGGLALGTWLGVRRLAGQVAEPILVALYALPKITLYPVILLIFVLASMLAYLRLNRKTGLELSK